MTDILLRRKLEMTTRDGVVLRADVIAPTGSGPVPAVVVRTPYGKESILEREWLTGLTAARAGFAYICQDQRGRHSSEGEPSILTEAQDGYDCIEWVAAQPWCDGNVGMVGASNMAGNAILTAMAQPPSLKAIVVEVTGDIPGPARFLTDHYFVGGCFRLDYHVRWEGKNSGPVAARHAAEGTEDPSRAERLRAAVDDPGKILATLPLSELAKVAGIGPEMGVEFLTMLQNPSPDSEPWKFMSFLLDQWRYDRILVPALSMSGWYDFLAPGTTRFHQGMIGESGSETARTGSRLMMGPWIHSDNLSPTIGDVAFGEAGGKAAAVNMILSFLGKHLRADDEAPMPDVSYFMMGAREWRGTSSWPPADPGSAQLELFLRSDGHAAAWPATGALSAEPPTTTEPPDEYVYDPADPAPALGGRNANNPEGTMAGPFDQTRLHCRSDVAVYVSEPLREELAVAGDPVITLWVSSSARDTDFIVRLCDVHPDGAAINIADGALRARYRDNLAEPTLLEPHTVYELTIPLGPTANVFKPGHRVLVHVTSSAFPNYDRNLNTGEPIGTDEKCVVAENSIHHTATHRSRLTLPTVAC